MVLFMFRKMAMSRFVEVSKEEELAAVWLQAGEEVGGEEEVEEVEKGVGEDVASRSVSELLRLG